MRAARGRAPDALGARRPRPAPAGGAGARASAGTPEAGPTEAFDRALAAHRLRVRARPRAGVVPAAARVAVRRGPARRGGHRRAARRLRLRGRRAHPAGRRRAHPGPHPLVPDDAAAPAAAPRLAVGVPGSRPRPARPPPAGVGRGSARRRWPPPSATRPRWRATSPSCSGTSRQLGDVLRRQPRPDRAAARPEPAAHQLARTTSWPARSARISWRERPATSGSARCSGGSSATCSAWRRATCSGTPAWSRSGADLTRLAEATLEGALDALDPQVPFAVVAFGRLGGGELGYASDLDVAFVHEGADARRGRAGRRRACSASSAATPRPSGSGPSTPTSDPRAAAVRCPRSLDGLGRATSTGGSSTWERQAYLRARAVAGDAALGARARRPHPGRGRGSSRSPATTSARCGA